MTRPAVLFARRTSVYRTLPCDVYDEDRDARTFDLAAPVVAHPPCRSWGKLSQLAKPAAHERDLALFAMWAVRHCGGVLEHPISSKLWAWFGIAPGRRDRFGGLLVPYFQRQWGHRALKLTGLYFVGCEPLLPDLVVEPASATVERMCRQERERTPFDLAAALVSVASCAKVAA